MKRVQTITTILGLSLILIFQGGCEDEDSYGYHNRPINMDSRGESEEEDGKIFCAVVGSEVNRCDSPSSKPVEPSSICDHSFLEEELELPSCGEKMLYVSGQGDDVQGTGTKTAPFQSIKRALQEVTATNRMIYVAEGNYEGDFPVPSGVRLSGGYEDQTWTKIPDTFSTVQNRVASILLRGNSEEVTLLEGFEILGGETSSPTIQVQQGARVIIRENRVTPNLAPVTWKTYGDTDHGTIISSQGASVQIIDNELFVEAVDPSRIISWGLDLRESCGLVSNNRIESVRTPIKIQKGSFRVTKNEIIDGENGIWVRDSDPELSQNDLRLKEATQGCTYAVYMEGESHPEIRKNSFYLPGPRTKGINESGSHEADPASLIGNRFVVGDPHTAIYMDADGTPDSGTVNHSLYSIDELNQLVDIPEKGGNQVEWR